MSNSKAASEMSYEELKSLLEGKRNERVSTLQKEIGELEASLSEKKSELAELSGLGAVLQTRRGRKPKTIVAATRKNPKGARRSRSSGLKDKILVFLGPKGKAGAHVDEIAQHVGKPKVNVNAFLATTGKKAGIKGKGRRSGVYYLKA
jgi:uncharacterized small protein (DUF1192 family)